MILTKKAKDRLSKIGVFVISPYGEVVTGVRSKTFVTVPDPNTGLYEELFDVIELTETPEDFYRTGIESNWFTTEDEAKKILDILKLQNEEDTGNLNFELDVISIAPEKLFSLLRKHKADDTVADQVIVSQDRYLSHFDRNGDYLFNIQWTKDPEEVLLFDEEAGNIIIKLLRKNSRYGETAELINITELDPSTDEDVEMFVAEYLIDGVPAGYLILISNDYIEIAESKESATWFTDERFREVWTDSFLDQVLTASLEMDSNSSDHEIRQVSLGLFDEDFINAGSSLQEAKNRYEV